MAKPLVSAEQWEALKALSIKGLSDSKLAEAFGVTVGAIQSRRFDDPIWAAAKKDQITQRGRPPLESNIVREQAAKQVLMVSSDSLAEIGEQNSLLLARYTAEKIKNSVQSDILPDPSNWAELKTASEILRKATGQDREGAAVSVNLFSGGCSFDDVAPTFDVTVETQEAPGADFC